MGDEQQCKSFIVQRFSVIWTNLSLIPLNHLVQPVGRNRARPHTSTSAEGQKCRCDHCKPKTPIEADKREKELKVERIKQQQAAKGRAKAELQRLRDQRQQENASK